MKKVNTMKKIKRVHFINEKDYRRWYVIPSIVFNNNDAFLSIGITFLNRHVYVAFEKWVFNESFQKASDVLLNQNLIFKFEKQGLCNNA